LAARGRRRSVFTVEALGQESGQGGLAGAPGSGEEVGVARPPRPQGIGQGPDDMLLAHHIDKPLRTPLAVEREVGHGASLFPCALHFPSLLVSLRRILRVLLVQNESPRSASAVRRLLMEPKSRAPIVDWRPEAARRQLTQTRHPRGTRTHSLTAA